MWFIVAILLRGTLAPWPGGKCEFSQDIISLCPYHFYQPTYIRNSVFRSVSKACPLFLSFGIHPSKGPSRGFWENTPPSFELCKSATTLSDPSLSHFFSATLSQSKHSHASAWVVSVFVCPLASTCAPVSIYL